MLRKAALVKRQILSQRELMMVNTWKLDSKSYLCDLVGCGHWVLSWGLKSALSPWWWLCSVRVVLEHQWWDEQCLCLPQLWLWDSFPWSVHVLPASVWMVVPKVQLQSREVLITQGQLRGWAAAQSRPVPPLGNRKDAQMWSCSMIHGTIIQFLNDLCFLFASWWKQVGRILSTDIPNCIIFTFW